MKNYIKNILKIISYQENTDREGFVLGENEFDNSAAGHSGSEQSNTGKEDERPSGEKEEGRPGEQGDSRPDSRGRDESPGAGGRKPRKMPRRAKNIQDDGMPRDADGDDQVSTRLKLNRSMVEQMYGLPDNKDLILREFSLGTDPPLGAFVIFIDGLVDRITLNSLLQNLMVFSRMLCLEDGRPASLVLNKLLPGGQAKELKSFIKIVEAVNYGDTAFFFEGSDSALVAETKGWEHRTVDKPDTEQTINGPQEAFVENLRANTGLVRKIVRSEKLYTEFMAVGRRFRSDVAMMYIKDLANPVLVEEVRRRIKSINVDFLTDTGMLEEYIEDSPYSLNSQTLSTERPDRVAAALGEGRVAIMLSGSPFALVAPVTMYEQLHTGEETYLRWQYGTFIRYIRTISFYLALLLPGAYLAIVLYHQEMIPTELLLAIASNRERVPFPTMVEMLMMEFSFELVREAGLRIPGIIGSTIGIVGALILGQAAVQANIVSPILVILVAVTGLASFSIPSYSLAFAVRIYRFFYILMGGLLGFFGVTIALFIQILLTANLKSFGVPYLSPSGPRTYAGPDIIYRLPIFRQRRRPDYLNTQDDIRLPVEPRGWLNKKGDGDEN